VALDALDPRLLEPPPSERLQRPARGARRPRDDRGDAGDGR
jgi:hypothetical protein